ncbi:MAG: PDZ domain-containing protein [Pirellulales bacterium]
MAATGAIAKLGFREADRIVSVNGHKVTTEADFNRFLFADDVRNQKVAVIVVRGGREETFYVEPSVLIEEMSYTSVDPLEQFGVVIDDRYNDRLVVWRVMPRTPAYYAGIRAGDVIMLVGDQKVSGIRALTDRLVAVGGGNVQIQVARNSNNRTLDIDLPRLEANGRRQTVLRPDLDAELRRDQRQDRRDDRTDDRRDRVNERNDDRREIRDERIDDRQDRRVNTLPATPATPAAPTTPSAPATPSVAPTPAPAIPATPATPRVEAPRTDAPRPALPRPGILPRNR